MEQRGRADTLCIGRSGMVDVCALRVEAVISVGPWRRCAGRGAVDERHLELAITANAVFERDLAAILAVVHREVEAILDTDMAKIEER